MFRARLNAIRRAIYDAKPRGKYGDMFMIHPCPEIGTPGKQVSYITDRGSFSPEGIVDEDHLARLYDKTSMLSLDTFFFQIRSDLSILARAESIPNRSSSEGKYVRYHPYRPSLVPKWLEIYRVYHNFVLPGGKDKKTPAMRMGLAKAPINIKEILNFRPT